MSNNINLEVNKMHHTSCNSNVKFPVWGTIVGDLNKQEDLMKLLSTLRKEELKRVRFVSPGGKHHPKDKDLRFYPSIHAAMHAAKEGDLILVWEDEYNESVTVNKDHITIKGLSSVVGRRAVELTGQLAISACNVSIEGVEVTGKTTIATTGGNTMLSNVSLKGNTHITGQGTIRIEKSVVRNVDIQSLLYANVFITDSVSEDGYTWSVNSLTSNLTIANCTGINLEHLNGEVQVFASRFVAPTRDSYVVRSSAETAKLFILNSSARGMNGVRGKVSKTGACDYQFSTFDFNREKSVLTGTEVDPDFYITDYYTREELDQLLNLKLDKTTFEQFQSENTEVIGNLKDGVNERIDREVEELNETINTLEDKVDANKVSGEENTAALDSKVESYKGETDGKISALDAKVDANKTACEEDMATLDSKVESYKGETDGKISDLNAKVDANKTEGEENLAALDSKVAFYKGETDGKIGDLDAKVDANKAACEEEVAGLNTKVESYKDETDGKISDLDGKVERYKENINGRLDNLKEKALAYKRSNDKAVADLDAKVDANKEACEQDIAGLSAKVDANKVEAGQAVDHLREEVITYRDKINGRVDTLTNKVKAYQQSNDQAVSDLNDKVDANKAGCEQELDIFKSETDTNFRDVQSEIDSLEARKVPYFGDSRILLDNNRNLLGLTTEGEGVNLAMVSEWDVADFGSAELPLNLNASERPTVQLAGQPGEEAEEIAFLSDVDAIQAEIDEMREIAANLVHIEFEQVDELPETGRNNIIYLVPHITGDEKVDYYFEYVWLESAGKYASIGTTEIDLTGYYTKEEVDAQYNDLADVIDEAVRDLSDNKQDVLLEGDNIKIEGRTISAIDTIYDDSELRGRAEAAEAAITGAEGAIDALEEEVATKASREEVYNKEEVDEKLDDIVAGQADMSLYYKKAETDGLLSGKQDLLEAGDNIRIVEGVISSKDTIYDDTELKDRMDAAESGIENAEEAIEALEAGMAGKANAGEVYTKGDVYNKVEVDGMLDDIVAGQADMSLYYKKTETDGLLEGKQDVLEAGDNIEIADGVISAQGYDDSELREELDKKANSDDVYSKEDLDERLDDIASGQADMSLYYKKTETDGLLEGKQDVLEAGENIAIEDGVISAKGYDDSELREELDKKANSEDVYSKEDLDERLDDIASGQADMSLYYKKSETDGLLEGKQDALEAGENIEIEDGVISAKGYDDSELREELDKKANSEDVYSKEDLDERLDDIASGQADMSLYYKKSETDGLLEGKQDVLEAGDYINIEDGVISVVDIDSYDDTALKNLIEAKADKTALNNYLGKTETAQAAQALQTGRNLWGRPFDGTSDVSGNMTGVGTLTATGTVKAPTFEGNLTGNVTGNASTATTATSATSATTATSAGTAGTADTLKTARTINGVSFNGSANIVVPVRFPAANVITLSNLTNVALDSAYDQRLATTANQTLSFATASNGAESIISIHNTGSANITITFPTANVQTDDATLVIAAGKIGEISVRYIFSKFVIKVI